MVGLPAAFTVPTGRAHWETLLRARAIENLCYVVAPAQVGTHTSGRDTYGDTLIVDYWGQVMARLPEGPGVVTAAFDLPGTPRPGRAFPRWITAGCRCRGARPSRYEAVVGFAAVRHGRAHDPRPAGPRRRAPDRGHGRLLSRGADYADLYFELSREESWSLEDGIVKEGSHSIEQGVGVRAISGEKTGFAYTDEVLLPALVEASDAARAIARSGGAQRGQGLGAAAHAPAVPADRSARHRPRRGQGRDG